MAQAGLGAWIGSGRPALNPESPTHSELRLRSGKTQQRPVVLRHHRRIRLAAWPQPALYESALALIASNSSWVIAPESSSCLAWAISPAEPPAASRTY